MKIAGAKEVLDSQNHDLILQDLRDLHALNFGEDPQGALDACVAKWRAKGEGAAMGGLLSSYFAPGKSTWMYSFLTAGDPTHNNALEGRNRWLKRDVLDNARPNVRLYVVSQIVL